MKNLKRKVEIIYNWWEVDGNEIEKEHLEELDEKGKNHVINEIKKGFTSGELPTVNKPSFDNMYRGYWKMQINTI